MFFKPFNSFFRFISFQSFHLCETKMDEAMAKEDAVISNINGIIDAAMERAEATLFKLDVNCSSAQRMGKYVPNPFKERELLGMNPRRNALAAPIATSTSKKKNPSRKAPAMQPPILEMDSEPYEPIKSPPKRTRKPSKMKKTPKKGIDGTKKMEECYEKLQDGNKCETCCNVRIVRTAHSPASQIASSVVSPSYGTFSCQTEQQRPPKPASLKISATDSFTTSRMSSSVVTEDDPTTINSSFPETSPCQSRALPPLLPKKPRRKRTPFTPASSVASSANASNKIESSSSGISIDFTAVVKDPKTGKPHPLHIVAKCNGGEPTRVFINGKAFGPSSDE